MFGNHQIVSLYRKVGKKGEGLSQYIVMYSILAAHWPMCGVFFSSFVPSFLKTSFSQPISFHLDTWLKYAIYIFSSIMCHCWYVSKACRYVVLHLVLVYCTLYNSHLILSHLHCFYTWFEKFLLIRIFTFKSKCYWSNPRYIRRTCCDKPHSAVHMGKFKISKLHLLSQTPIIY